MISVCMHDFNNVNYDYTILNNGIKTLNIRQYINEVTLFFNNNDEINILIKKLEELKKQNE